MNMEEKISISFAISDNYSQHLAVFATSVLEHNPGSAFVFHILHSNVSNANQMRIRMLEQIYPGKCRVMFHDVGDLELVKLPIPTSLDHISGEAYFRYMLPEVLRDDERTIYSDVDVLCRGDISELWRMDLGDSPIAAVRDPHIDDDVVRHKAEIGMAGDSSYYHSGLLVMNLAMMRAESSSAKLFSTTAKIAQAPSFAGDMDGINVVFEHRIAEIDAKYNCCDKYSPWRKDVVIWHFPGAVVKPWCNIPKNRSWLAYLRYLLLSPYRGNAFRFVFGHLLGFVYFSYLKNGIRRYLVLGIRVYKRREK